MRGSDRPTLGWASLLEPASGATVAERSRLRGALSLVAAVLVLVVALVSQGGLSGAWPEVTWAAAAAGLALATRVPALQPVWDRIGGVTAIVMISLLLIIAPDEDHHYVALFYLNGVFGAAYYSPRRLRLESALSVTAIVVSSFYSDAHDLGGLVVNAVIYAGVVWAVAWLVERTRESEQLRSQAQLRYEAAFEASPMPITTLGLDGRITAANPAFIEWSGYPAEAIEGLTFRDLAAPEHVAAAEAAFARVIAGEAVHTERVVLDAHGRRRHVATTSLPLTDGRTQLGVWTVARDITGERSAAEALRASEERYRRLIENLPAVVYLIAPESPGDSSPFWFISPQVEEWLGHPLRSMLTDRSFPRSLIHPDDLDRVVARTREAVLDGRGRRLEYRVLDAHGNVHWVLDQMDLVPGPNDEPGWLQGVLLDITAEKTAERELSLRAERQRQLVALADVALGADSVEEVIRSAVETAASVCGAASAVYYRVVGGRLVAEVEHGAAHAAPSHVLAALPHEWLGPIQNQAGAELPPGAFGGPTEGRTFAAWINDGREGALLVVLGADATLGAAELEDHLQLLAGILAGSLQVASTVDRLRRSERSARRQADRATTVIAASPLPILELDGGERVVIFNDEAAALFELGPDSIGRSLPDVLPELATSLAGAITMARTGGRPPEVQLVTEVAGGRRAVLRVHTSSGGYEEAERHVVLFIVDETDRLALEAHAAQATKMEALGRLSGGIAHDLNNLLTVIRSYADLASTSADPDERRHDLEELMRVVDEGAELVASILGHPRPAAGEVRPLDLVATLREDRGLYERVLPVGVELTLEVPVALPEVRIAPAHLRGALLNLLRNAADAVGDSGQVTIRAEQGDGAAMVRVIDDGPGMEPATAARAVEPFFTTKEGQGGSGIGLYSVYRFATGYGGRLDIDSVPGRGTSVSISLPADRTDAEFGSATVDAPRGARLTRAAAILLVEDDPQILPWCTGVLRSAGHEVTAVPSAEDALPLLRARAFDALVSDVVLPGMNGVVLVRTARRLRPELGVVLMSGHIGDTAIQEGIRGVDLDLLAKPFSRQQLLNRVADALRPFGASAR